MMHTKKPVNLCSLVLLAVLVNFFAACEHPMELTPPEDTSVKSLLAGWRTASWTPFTVSDSLTGFAYGKVDGKDVYVAVSKTGVIAWSNDGDVWIRGVRAAGSPDDPFDAQFNAVAYGGGFFIAVGDNGKIARSVNGKAWTSGPTGGIVGFGSTNHIYGIAWGKDTAWTNGYFVAVGGNSDNPGDKGRISMSVDGDIWIWSADTSSQINDIAYGGDAADPYFYIVGDAGQTGFNSNPALPGSSWTYKGPVKPYYTNSIRKLALGAYGDESGIGVVFNEWSGRRLAVCTADTFRNGVGEYWDADVDAGLFGNNTLNGIAWGLDDEGNGNYLAAGTGAMIGFWPSAPYNQNPERYWRALSFSEFNGWEITALKACNNRFFAGGIGGKIGYRK
jgi:hypothetical protein